MNARSFFVTGTDTGIGKALAAAALLRRLRARIAAPCLGTVPFLTRCDLDAAAGLAEAARMLRIPLE